MTSVVLGRDGMSGRCKVGCIGCRRLPVSQPAARIGARPYWNWEVVHEPSTSRPENLSDAAAGRHYRRTLSHRRRHRAIASIYETVFGSRILSRGDSKGAPGYIQIANTWLIVNVGGGPTPDKPSVTLSVPADPDSVSSFMNIRVPDIQACYELWRSRGAEFITEPKDKYGETRCYIRDPDG